MCQLIKERLNIDFEQVNSFTFYAVVVVFQLENNHCAQLLQYFLPLFVIVRRGPPSSAANFVRLAILYRFAALVPLLLSSIDAFGRTKMT